MVFQGLPVSRGIAMGRSFVYAPFKIKIGESYIGNAEKAEHNARFNEAVKKAAAELRELQEKMAEEDPDKAGIFEAHEDILTDVAIIEEILKLINEESYAGGYAIEQVYEKYVHIFAEMDDDIMRERCADFRDVKDRILRIWAGVEQKNLSELDFPAIIFARDLLPSDTATLNRNNVLAIVTETGGNTSHSAIIARSYEIPALLGITGIMNSVRDGMTAVVDALDGNVILEPGEAEQAGYLQKQADYNRTAEEIRKFRSVEPVMADGTPIDVFLNIGSVSDEELEASAFTGGVGLFRSEFLFMQGKNLPGENQQFQVYKKAVEVYGTRQVILRTLDIGGDKTFESMDLPEEDNPFLGCRALRLCFQKTDVFKTQLRAALRASSYGNLALMFPMVGSLEDLHKAKYYLEECRTELESEGVPFNKNMSVGIMIEIPAVAVMADLVVHEVDFASIGTNDLCQYLMAVDRLNPNVAAYYQSYHPAMFRLIHNAARVFEKEGKSLSICGEMGGDPMAVMAFIGMGIKKFSMAASNVSGVKRIITRLTMTRARELADKLRLLSTAPRIEDLLKTEMERLIAQ
ncbi:MAG: phosphoenolpyruvate--protein phosphotransferase [Treponema sp.]|jgi:phosphotransferase system enzyme I (PtsI)|nr:phosphoenolpyruvate--protein phosphotransferase [Treponema sp.]